MTPTPKPRHPMKPEYTKPPEHPDAHRPSWTVEASSLSNKEVVFLILLGMLAGVGIGILTQGYICLIGGD